MNTVTVLLIIIALLLVGISQKLERIINKPTPEEDARWEYESRAEKIRLGVDPGPWPD